MISVVDKTVLQLANEIGISKQRLYRYIKKHISDVHQINGVMYITDAEETLIKSKFFKNSVSDEVHHDSDFDAVIDVLKRQLDEKDKQIEKLQAILLQTQENLKFAQQLHGADKIQQITEGKAIRKWQFWRKK